MRLLINHLILHLANSNIVCILVRDIACCSMNWPSRLLCQFDMSGLYKALSHSVSLHYSVTRCTLVVLVGEWDRLFPPVFSVACYFLSPFRLILLIEPRILHYHPDIIRTILIM